jgi:ABC-type transport system involved in multi-copper enzyme maturation permease subunit
MWYKEWLAVRPKFIMTAVIMTGLALLVIVGRPNSWTDSMKPNSSYFSIWAVLAAFVVVLMGIIGGADLFSAEKDQNTFSFLLTKPVSRAKVFAVKIGLNAASIGVVLVGSSLLLLFFDNMPRMVEYQQLTVYENSNGYISWTVGDSSQIPAVGTSLGAALPAIAGGIALGFAVLCLTALISLITSNVLQTCLVSLMAVTFLGIILITLTVITGGPNLLSNFYKPSAAFLYLGILTTLAFGFLIIGARAFKRKEL